MKRDELLHAYLAARDGRVLASAAEFARLEGDVLDANDGLVFMVAMRYGSRQHDPSLFDDLVQEGRLGLLASVRRYQVAAGASLATFAMYRIRERIARWVYEQVPPLRINATTQRQARRREDATGVLDARVPRAVSLTAIRDPEEPPFDLPSPVPSPDQVVVSREARTVLGLAVAALPARERDLFIRHFGLDGGPRVRQVVLAAELGISPQRVSQILTATARRLRAQPAVAALGPDVTPPVLERGLIEKRVGDPDPISSPRPRTGRPCPSGPCLPDGATVATARSPRSSRPLTRASGVRRT